MAPPIELDGRPGKQWAVGGILPVERNQTGLGFVIHACDVFLYSCFLPTRALGSLSEDFWPPPRNSPQPLLSSRNVKTNKVT